MSVAPYAMAPIESYPFVASCPGPAPAYTQGSPYPVVGFAKGVSENVQYDIVRRDGRFRIEGRPYPTLLPEDVKERVAAGDTDWDGQRLTFYA